MPMTPVRCFFYLYVPQVDAVVGIERGGHGHVEESRPAWNSLFRNQAGTVAITGYVSYIYTTTYG